MVRGYIGMENFHPNERNLICDDHFEKKCFYKTTNGHTGFRINAFLGIFPRSSFKDSYGTVSIGVTDDLIYESGATECIARKRLFTEELPDPQHVKLIEDGNNSFNLIDENSSLNYAGSSYYKREDNATVIEVTASNTLTRHCTEESRYLFFCLLFYFVLWFLAFVVPNLGTKTSQSADRMVIKMKVDCPNTSEASSGQNFERATEVADTPLRIQLLEHDHHYNSTPRGLKRRYRIIRRRLDTSKRESKVQKQHIGLLNKKITTLFEIVSELRRTKAVSEDGLACLDSIVDSDVSQLLTRFPKNSNSIRDKKPAGKRLFKSQRRTTQDERICRDKYPPSLRSFAISLHFHSENICLREA